MTQTEINKAAKKADTALCKLQDLFYMNVNSSIATKVSYSLDKVRELISEIESTEPKRKSKS